MGWWSCRRPPETTRGGRACTALGRPLTHVSSQAPVYRGPERGLGTSSYHWPDFRGSLQWKLAGSSMSPAAERLIPIPIVDVAAGVGEAKDRSRGCHHRSLDRHDRYPGRHLQLRHAKHRSHGHHRRYPDRHLQLRQTKDRSQGRHHRYPDRHLQLRHTKHRSLDRHGRYPWRHLQLRQTKHRPRGGNAPSSQVSAFCSTRTAHSAAPSAPIIASFRSGAKVRCRMPFPSVDLCPSVSIRGSAPRWPGSRIHLCSSVSICGYSPPIPEPCVHLC